MSIILWTKVNVLSTVDSDVINTCWMGISLVVQWMRICLPMQWIWVHSLVWEDYTCYGATKSMCHNYWVQALEPVSHTAEPVCHNCWNPCASSPCSLAREATAMRSLCITTKSSHHSLQLEKDHTKQWRPNVIKNKLIN